MDKFGGMRGGKARGFAGEGEGVRGGWRGDDGRG